MPALLHLPRHISRPVLVLGFSLSGVAAGVWGRERAGLVWVAGSMRRPRVPAGADVASRSGSQLPSGAPATTLREHTISSGSACCRWSPGQARRAVRPVTAV
jgi:hypothetical protein